MKLIKLILLLLICFSTSISNAKQSIHIAAEEIEGFTKNKHRSIYWELFRLIYVDYNLEIHIKPIKRVEKLLTNKNIDIVFPFYKQDIESELHGAQPFDYDRVSALFKKSKFKEWHGIKNNISRRFVWVVEHGYENYFDIKNYREARDQKQALKMLERNRVDFYLNAKDDIEIAFKKLQLDSTEYGIAEVIRLGLYPFFANNEKGMNLKSIYDKRLTEIKNNGKLKSLFQKHKLDYLHDKAKLKQN